MFERSPVLGEVNPLASLDRASRGFGVDLASAPAVGCVFHETTEREENTMLRIYPVCITMVGEIRPYAERIARFDRDLARQLRKSSTAVPLNVAEGSGLRGGRRRQSYDYALGEARETLANLEAAQAIGYVPSIEPRVRRRLNHIIGTLVNLVR
jgi:four helix bundle protein